MTSPEASAGAAWSPVRRNAFARGARLASITAATVPTSTVFNLCGLEWDLRPGVFAPTLCLSTQFFAESIPYPDGGTLLEVGCGTGVISVIAAASGCSQVTAVDISEAAVANTAMNVARHSLAERVRVLQGDLFAALAPADRFDLIFWNSPFIDPPVGFEPANDLDGAIFDPAYGNHGRFVRDGPRRLAAGGRLLLGFSSLGNHAALERIVGDAGRDVRTLRTSGGLVSGIEYELLELVAHDAEESSLCRSP